MNSNLKYALCLVAGWGLSAQMATAQMTGFDPRADCSTILNQSTPANQEAIAAWTFGFLAATRENVRPIDPQNTATLLGNLACACQASPGSSLLALVQGDGPPAPAAPQAQQIIPGSYEDARALLQRFYAPGADHRALTQALLPTEAEVKAVYAEPLGSALWADYAAQMTPDVAFAPKADHNDLLIVHTTTRALFDQQPVLQEFPGGYKEVLQYLKVDVPIVRFKFITSGETLGLAFDGLIYLNNRWVIMPKPWRSLPG